MGIRIPHREVENLKFSVYRPQEVKKLSVVEILNPTAFDGLDHPVLKGLYDPHMGPSEPHETCLTCGLGTMHCPGHIGHIELPLPVYNPVFIKTLYQILQGSCFNCHRLMAPDIATTLALHQFQALDYGLVGVVQELAEIVSDPSSVSPSSEVKSRLEKLISDSLAVSGYRDESRLVSRTKNLTECTQRVIKEFILTHLSKSKSNCPHCNSKKQRVLLRQNHRFVCGVSKQISVASRMEKQNLSSSIPENEELEENLMQTNDQFNTDLTPVKVKEHLKEVWKNDSDLLKRLFSILNVQNTEAGCPVDVFFTDYLMVPPARFRPISVVKGRKYLNAQSTVLKDVLNDVVSLRNLLKTMKGEKIGNVEKDLVDKIQGKTNLQKMNFIWHELQLHVNYVYDSDLDKLNKDRGSCGVKQVLEKKEGLFRKHMMGKRVNYAARSVISPDPYIMVDEIGVPLVFAQKLTFPVPVTNWNIKEMMNAVINGPNVYPGADKVEIEDGKIVKLKADDPVQRQGIACKLLTPSSRHDLQHGFPKKVHRHLKNGDIMLLNRQPTLHKPSIMAHKARVLPGEKTLRLHYANCKAYNADFDGDEMNAHFPQSELARAEGYHIMSVNHQYLVPKDGTPLSGLIQDHIIAGTLLTLRDRFFTRQEYHQLVYGAIDFVIKNIFTLPPCLLKPKKLWSGKQVFSTVVINLIPTGKPLPTVEGKAKVSSKNWQNAKAKKWHVGGTLSGDDMTESEVIIRSGELLCGIIDKAQVGPTPYGLIHCCYELYGGEISTALLTALAKLFTHFLQIHTGFTLGVEDILLTEKATKKRRKIIHGDVGLGNKVIAESFDLDVSDVQNQAIVSKFRQAHLKREDTLLKLLDFEMKKITDSLNNDINGICMPDGLLKKFPKNNLQLMVQSGAKGSTVNAMQISCLLGQIELEGRRVPLMLNGSTLPSFKSYDTSPSAGGFVNGRFLTGIRPQEFFFHCMAGREGLVDTAVKTSRSGYLQRCLIKHLEGLVVNYDLTVRDSDGSLIQFLYGEDGLDISKMQMLKKEKFNLMINNHNAVMNDTCLHEFIKHQQLCSFTRDRNPLSVKNAISKWERKTMKREETRYSSFLRFEAKYFHPDKECQNQREVTKEWHHLKPEDKAKCVVKKCPDPVTSIFRPDLVFGAVSERLNSLIEDYVTENKMKIFSETLVEDHVKNLIYYRALSALAHPGEAVGLLAAQSIGEPSTQMTLNTFHFAGRGEMNVTLGIPRLREILMVASANIATPTMDLPLKDVPNVEDKAENLRLTLSSIHLKQVLESIEVEETIVVERSLNRFRKYSVKLNILPFEAYKDVYYTSPTEILTYIDNVFIHHVIAAMKKKYVNFKDSKLVSYAPKSQRSAVYDEDIGPAHEDENMALANEPSNLEGDSSDDGEGDGDTMSTKLKNRHNQDLEYEEPEVEEKMNDIADDIFDNEEDSIPLQNEEYELKAILQESETERLKSVKEKAMKQSRIRHVQDKYEWISYYNYSLKGAPFCEFTIQLHLENNRLDLHSIVEDIASHSVLYSVPGIKKAFLVKNSRSQDTSSKMLKTDGVNFLEIFKYDDILDMRRVYSNDIHAISKIYGIEAASRVIVKEIKNVFATYGIEVDPRHLLLIADYMTFDGTYKPCNRIGMSNSASPLQQMSFETTMNFLQSAALSGSEEQLRSPSSRIIVGKLVGSGTGIFDLWLKMQSANTKPKMVAEIQN